MKILINNKEQLLAYCRGLFTKCNQLNFNPFYIETLPFSKKRSGQQLRAYWRLITVCQNYMNSQNNHFTQEQVSDYFKIMSNHFLEIKGIKIPKSISDKSLITREDMKRIIDCVLEFGLNYGLEDCYIRNEELEELLNYYGNKY